MRKFLFLIAILILDCSFQKEWYRKLPIQNLPKANLPLGTYKKKLNSRAPLNSKYVFHEATEKIIIVESNQFIREHESRWSEGANTKKTFITARGSYQNNGNWILFETKQINYKFFENGKQLQERTLDVKTELLYYFWKNEKVLIPMIYETGFEEKNFGVKDGVKIPYDELEPSFLRYLQFYTYEEYQSHAYFLE